MIVLASASPRRRELLALLGVPFRVRATDVDESVLAGETPEAYVLRLARAKAAAAQAEATALVLAADTTVAIGGAILGKPGTVDEAVAMLRRLSGERHRVLTGYCARRGGSACAEGVEISVVAFRPLAEATIRAYAASGEPMDKAGAYAIQGLGAGLVSWVEGSFTNVVGLPMERIVEILAAEGMVGGAP